VPANVDVGLTAEIRLPHFKDAGLKAPRGPADKAEDMTEPQKTAKVEASAFSEPREAAAREARTQEDLHVCPSCDSGLVFPTDWAPAAGRRWTVDLRCPECEWLGGGTYAQPIVDRFDEALDDGTEALLRDLNLLTRANMEEQVDAFVAALNADQILPEDF
jgi:hypothetical protein